MMIGLLLVSGLLLGIVGALALLVASLMKRVETLARALLAHLEWHEANETLAPRTIEQARGHP